MILGRSRSFVENCRKRLHGGEQRGRHARHVCMEPGGGGQGMRKQAFGPYQVSVIGLGSTDFGGRCPEEEAWAFMDAYMELGGNFLDTAHVYGDFVTPKNGESERVIGRWMAQRHNREKIFLSTKGAHPPIRDMAKSRLDRASICQDMAESLEALGTDHVDIYWLHRDDICRPVGEIVETLQELVENGYTRMTGVSNWTSARILEADAYAREHGLNRIIANQLQFSLAKPASFGDPTLCRMDGKAFRMHRETGMVCCCFTAQAHGFFTKLDENSLPDRLRDAYMTPENLAVYERMRELRAHTGLSMTALSLAFLTSQPFPTFALAGASRMEHVLALKEAGDAVLTQEQCRYLRDVGAEDL